MQSYHVRSYLPPCASSARTLESPMWCRALTRLSVERGWFARKVSDVDDVREKGSTGDRLAVAGDGGGWWEDTKTTEPRQTPDSGRRLKKDR